MKHRNAIALLAMGLAAALIIPPMQAQAASIQYNSDDPMNHDAKSATPSRAASAT